jgi:hypothetical protein
MPNETKRIAVRPNIGSALQRAVDQARFCGTPVSLAIHEMAEVAEAAMRRKAKRKEQA